MKNETKKALLKWILEFEENSHIFAEKYGSFSLARMDFNVFISDDGMENFDEAEKLIIANDGIAPNIEVEKNYYRYIQAHNHELFHYYQALALPAFQIYQKITKTKTEHEAATMLRYFEDGYSYILGESKTILEALNNPTFKLSKVDENNFYDSVEKYKYFAKQWTAEHKNISLFHIIEGMAHIMSVQLTPNTTNYLSGTEDNPIYNMAYDLFYSHVDEEFNSIDIRINHLTFLYICYFSCHIYSFHDDSVVDKSTRLFHFLCTRINEYYKALEKFKNRYINYSENELRELNQFSIADKDIQNATKNQLINIYSFYELIPCIQQDAEKFYDNSFDTYIPKEIIEVLSSLNIDLSNIYQLANFALFPAKMADIWEAYDIIQKLEIDDKKFDIAGESGFLELIENCKNILKNNISYISCCNQHGKIADKLEVLYCENIGSFAYYLKELTKREPIDLFKIEETI
jgi:hypothetical protein